MTPLYAAALEVQEVCRAHGWAFCFIGGIAVARWGELRYTDDVDLTVRTGFGAEQTFIDALLGRFTSRFDDAGAFALRSRVVLARASNGVPIDVALGAVPFEERAVKRATCYEFDHEVVLRTCSAEDLVVLKAFAGRDRDWADIRGVVMRQGSGLDQQLVWDELLPLLELKETTEDAARLHAILSEG